MAKKDYAAFAAYVKDLDKKYPRTEDYDRALIIDVYNGTETKQGIFGNFEVVDIPTHFSGGLLQSRGFRDSSGKIIEPTEPHVFSFAIDRDKKLLLPLGRLDHLNGAMELPTSDKSFVYVMNIYNLDKKESFNLSNYAIGSFQLPCTQYSSTRTIKNDPISENDLAMAEKLFQRGAGFLFAEEVMHITKSTLPIGFKGSRHAPAPQ